MFKKYHLKYLSAAPPSGGFAEFSPNLRNYIYEQKNRTYRDKIYHECCQFKSKPCNAKIIKKKKQPPESYVENFIH
ncbi:hypothetical protein HZS_2337 [Henneguya salminicola]|nr:hypothetical protein HZS_2337 [Henneguya salminicola]